MENSNDIILRLDDIQLSMFPNHYDMNSYKISCIFFKKERVKINSFVIVRNYEVKKLYLRIIPVDCMNVRKSKSFIINK